MISRKNALLFILLATILLMTSIFNIISSSSPVKAPLPSNQAYQINTQAIESTQTGHIDSH